MKGKKWCSEPLSKKTKKNGALRQPTRTTQKFGVLRQPRKEKTKALNLGTKKKSGVSGGWVMRRSCCFRGRLGRVGARRPRLPRRPRRPAGHAAPAPRGRLVSPGPAESLASPSVYVLGRLAPGGLNVFFVVFVAFCFFSFFSGLLRISFFWGGVWEFGFFCCFFFVACSSYYNFDFSSYLFIYSGLLRFFLVAFWEFRFLLLLCSNLYIYM